MLPRYYTHYPCRYMQEVMVAKVFCLYCYQMSCPMCAMFTARGSLQPMSSLTLWLDALAFFWRLEHLAEMSVSFVDCRKPLAISWMYTKREPIHSFVLNYILDYNTHREMSTLKIQCYEVYKLPPVKFLFRYYAARKSVQIKISVWNNMPTLMF